MQRPMEQLEHSIEVDAPITATYNQWTQFEDFPRFMEGVESVTQLDDTHVHWVAEVAGKKKEWAAGDALGLVRRRVEGDMERFKEFIEARGRETGGWRREVHGGETGDPG